MFSMNKIMCNIFLILINLWIQEMLLLILIELGSMSQEKLIFTKRLHKIH